MDRCSQTLFAETEKRLGMADETRALSKKDVPVLLRL